jgi:hypothetical protein
VTVMAGTCSRCASGNHSSHMVSLGGICVGCACPFVMKADRVESRTEVLESAAALARGQASGPVPIALAELFEEFARLDDQGIHPPTTVVTLAKRYLGDPS